AISRILWPFGMLQMADDHLSGDCVAAALKRSTRTLGGQPRDVFCLILHRMGFTEPGASPRPLVVSYSTLSTFRPMRLATFCGPSLRIAPGGRSLASFPVVSGLSSTSCRDHPQLHPEHLALPNNVQ